MLKLPQQSAHFQTFAKTRNFQTFAKTVDFRKTFNFRKTQKSNTRRDGSTMLLATGCRSLVGACGLLVSRLFVD